MAERKPQSNSDHLQAIRTHVFRGAGRPGHFEKPRDTRHALRRLAGYLKPYRRKLYLVAFFVVAYTLLGLAEPYLIGVAIDRFIATKAVAGLLKVAALLLLIYLCDNGLQAWASWIMAKISQDALKTLRFDLFAHLQRLAIAFFDRHHAGELMSRLTNDIEAINQAVSQNVVALLASTLTMVGILAAMFALNARLALASLVAVPLMLGFAHFVARYTRRGFRDLQQQLGGINSVMEETISGARVVKAFRQNEAAVAEFRRHNREVYRAGVYANSYALLMMPLTTVLGNFFVITLAGLGGWLALHDLVTVGTIAAFLTYGRNFVQPLRQLANLYNSIQAALAGAERVFETIDIPPEIDRAQPAPLPAKIRGAVRFDAVSFGYRPEQPVIKGMSLEVMAGQTVALVGPTGAGKTTLINLLLRFYEVDSGAIAIDGRDLRDFPKDELRDQLGLVLQDTFLFADTVMENIRFGHLTATDEEVMEAARLADADHFIRLLPEGYRTRLSERAGNLSQGQRQMLAIARAILADPAILILDEATSSVDTRTETRIQAALLRLMQGRTSFVIAHRLSTIRDADLVVVINDGAIVEQGNHQDLLDKRGFYYDLYMSQFKGQEI